MISLEKWKILTTLQKLPKNVGNLAKLIVATSSEKLPKVQLIAQSGHTGLSYLMKISQQGMELFSRRRWRLISAQVVSCCVYENTKQ